MGKLAISAAVLSAIDQAFQTRFNRARANVPGFYRKLCMEISSTAGNNVYGWLADLPQVKRVVGEYDRKRLQLVGYQLTNEKFGTIIEVLREAIEDDQYGMYANVAAALGTEAARVPDLELVTLLGNSFTEKDYTGSAFFAANKKAHSKATAFTNKDTKKLNAANFQAAYANLRARKSASGAPLFTLQDPSQIYLVVDPEDEATADAIVRMRTLTTGGENPNYNKAVVLVIPGLKSGNDLPWFLFDCGQEVKPLIFQNRTPFELVANFSPTSENVFNEDVYSWKTRGRLAMGFGLPEYAFGSTGADPAA